MRRERHEIIAIPIRHAMRNGLDRREDEMRIAVPHHTTKGNARSRIEQKLTALLTQFGGRVDDLQQQWNGDTLTFKGKARGFAVSGTVEVTDDEIIIDGKLPFMAKPFEPKIREAVKKEADAMFRTA